MKYLILFMCLSCLTYNLTGRELISNGEFNKGLSNWVTWYQPGSAAEGNFNITIDTMGVLSGKNSARAEIFNGDATDWYIQLNASAPIQTKARYYMKYMIAAESELESITINVVMQANAGAYSWYWNNIETFLPGESKRFSHVYEHTEETGDEDYNNFRFYMGGHGENEVFYWIDSCSVVEEGPFWRNVPLENKYDKMLVQYRIYPDSVFNGIVGLSDEMADDTEDAACGIRFNPNGTIEALHDDSYQADAVVNYDHNEQIKVTMIVDLSAKRYTVDIDDTRIAQDYGFSASDLNYLYINVDTDPANGGRPMSGMRVTNLSVEDALSIERDKNSLPVKFALKQNFPNPFNPVTKIEYSLDEKSFVKLSVYDILGREVAVLVKAEKTVGEHQASFDAHNLTSGVYFYRLQKGNMVLVKKMVVVK
jgi:hypothetical protein